MNESFDYAQYLKFAELQGIDPKDRLTEDEFYSPEVTSEKEGGDSIIEKAFLPKQPNPAQFFAAADFLNDLANTPAGKRVIGNAKTRMNARFAKMNSKWGTAFNVGDSTMPGTGSSQGMGGSSYSGSGSGGARFNFGMAPMNPVPMKINLTTPITPNCFPDYFLDSDSHSNSELHITCATLTWDNMDAKMQRFYNNVLMNDLTVKLQQSNDFRVNLADLSNANYQEYLESLTQALLACYSITSIFEYCQPQHKHKNLAMFRLRDSFSAESVELLYELIRMLATYPIPPRLNELCWYLGQNYKSSENPGSAMIKILPFSLGQTANSGFSPTELVADVVAHLDTVITRLSNAQNRRVAATLGTASPDWEKSVDVMAPAPEVAYSPNFNTIWSNAPFINGSHYAPHVTNVDTPIFYYTHAGRLDGAAYALTAIRNTTTNQWEPSLFQPEASIFNNNNLTNRFAYESTTDKFDVLFVNNSLPIQRGESHVALSYNIPSIQVMPFGAERRDGVTVNTVRDSAIQLMEWLFSVDTIKDNTKAAKKEKRGRNRGRMMNSTDIVSDKE
jgi:hypothetical protein